MRSRTAPDDRVAEVTRRRLEALIAELAEARGEPPPDPPRPSDARSDPVPERMPRGRHAQRPLGPGRRLAGWASDRVPAPLQGVASIGPAQVGLLLLVVAIGLVLSAWFLVRAAGGGAAGEVVPTRPQVTAPGTPAPAAAAGSDAPVATRAGTGGAGEQIVVDVVGRVRRPGIVVLPRGSRVVDAVRAAGGVRRGVDPTTLNMARLLTDGEQVLVGVVAGVPSAGATTSGAPPSGSTGQLGGLVNLNSADEAALETLPGVGPVTAAAIVQWRTEHGGFTAVEELLEVSGIGEVTLAEIEPHVTL